VNHYLLSLVRRLNDAKRPLSRNRHFHTFANAEGRRALRIARRLRSLAHEIREQARRGAPIRVERVFESGSLVRVLLELVHVRARRVTLLSAAEFELLLEGEGVREALDGP